MCVVCIRSEKESERLDQPDVRKKYRRVIGPRARPSLASTACSQRYCTVLGAPSAALDASKSADRLQAAWGRPSVVAVIERKNIR